MLFSPQIEHQGDILPWMGSVSLGVPTTTGRAPSYSSHQIQDTGVQVCQWNAPPTYKALHSTTTAGRLDR